MAEIHIVFTTDRFNCSQPRPHYINDCCYGDDLAAWLAEGLRKCEFRVDEPGQEDWGWYLHVWSLGGAYFVAIGATTTDKDLRHAGGRREPTPAREINRGEWRVIVQRRCALWQRLFGRNRISADDQLVQSIVKILAAEMGVKTTISGGAHM